MTQRDALCQTPRTLPAQPKKAGESGARRCLASGALLPKSQLVRFVVDPAGQVVPDIGEILPGRGLWLTARRDILERAVAKGLFAKARRASAVARAGLADEVERQLGERCINLLGLARRAGAATFGADRVANWLASGQVGLLVVARDGAGADQRARGEIAAGIRRIDCLTAAEMGRVFGRDRVARAAVMPGPLADLLASEGSRRAGFRLPAVNRAGARNAVNRAGARNKVAAQTSLREADEGHGE